MNWIAIGPLSAIPGRGSRVVDTPQGDIALFRTAENKVYALLDRCPHRGRAPIAGHCLWKPGCLPAP